MERLINFSLLSIFRLKHRKVANQVDLNIDSVFIVSCPEL